MGRALPDRDAVPAARSAARGALRILVLHGRPARRPMRWDESYGGEDCRVLRRRARRPASRSSSTRASPRSTPTSATTFGDLRSQQQRLAYGLARAGTVQREGLHKRVVLAHARPLLPPRPAAAHLSPTATGSTALRVALSLAPPADGRRRVDTTEPAPAGTPSIGRHFEVRKEPASDDVDTSSSPTEAASTCGSVSQELAGEPGIRVIVVDNACPDHSTDTITDLEVQVVRMGAQRRLRRWLQRRRASRHRRRDPLPQSRRADAGRRRQALGGRAAMRIRTCGAVGPHILETSGEDQPSMRRAPALRTALRRGVLPPPPLPACVLGDRDRARAATTARRCRVAVRRRALRSTLRVRVGRRFRRAVLHVQRGYRPLHAAASAAGFRVRYEPSATAMHEGGGSAPRPLQAALRAEARIHVRPPARARVSRYRAFRVAYRRSTRCCGCPLAALRSRTHLRGRLGAVRAFRRHRRPGTSQCARRRQNERELHRGGDTGLSRAATTR